MKQHSTKDRNTCDKVKKGSIQNFFNKSVRAVKKTVACPICQKQVELHAINTHIDSSKCKVGVGEGNGSQDVIDLADSDNEENDTTPPNSSNTLSVIKSRKRKSEEHVNVTKNSKLKVDKNGKRERI